MIIELLLLGILLAEGIRLHSLWQKKDKKNYFKQRLEGIDREIWDTEFSRHKAKEIKEQLRVEMTALKSKQETLRQEIKKHEELKDMPEGDLARLKDQDEVLNVKINKIVYGIGKPKLNDDGSVNEEETAKIQREIDMCIKGIDQQLGFLNEKVDSYQELKGMVKMYLHKEI